MFYLSKQVKKVFICGICNEKYDDPRIVPCSETFCNKCIIASTDKKFSFSCICSGKKHLISKLVFIKKQSYYNANGRTNQLFIQR